MARGFRASHAAIFLRAGNLGLIFLGLVALVGCQGFSSTKPADQQQQSGTLVLGSASLEFGSVTTGTSKTLATTVSNTGAASVTISSVAISNQNFSLSGPSLPVTIAVGQNSTISLVFTPNAAGAFSATVSVSSNASNVSTTLSLSGTGVANGQLALNPTSQSFGSVTVGSQSNQIVTLTNNSASTVNISQASVSGSGFKLNGVTAPIALNASQSTTFTVTFAPQSTAPASGSVTITSDAPNPTLSMPLSGTGVALAALGSSPTSLAFGSVQVGNNQALAETVSNTGGSSLTLSQVGISGTGFTLSGITTPVTLTPGQSASFSVSFTPQSASSASGSLTITSNASNPMLTIPVSGTGTAAAGQLTANPSTLALGSVVVGTSGTASGSLNASAANVTVTAASTNNSQFTVGGLALPITIPAGQSAPFTVTFSPPVAGAASATLTFTSNAQPATATETLTGTGTPAPAHTVSLSWSASSSSDISGYNIYRAVYTSSCGSYSKINGSTLDTVTTYSDSSVTDGANYCYATTAVNSSNEESGYSNVVSDVQIPSP
ncbi:MAG: choice-of-anchor D domain-containing protein [Candidatus Sulfotelmatobacter sp.]